MKHSDLDAEFRALVDFARNSKVPAGFGYMGADGEVDLNKPIELWINGRMTHVFALATLYGIEGAREYMQHGVKSLTDYFRDHDYGGWYASIESVPRDGRGVAVNDRKEAYAQAFVILAAASALAAGEEAAAPLLQAALDEQLEHWYDPATGKVAESWNREFTEAEDYRGINANMHTVEALISAADVLGDVELLERATGVLKFVYDTAKDRGWRIPEHYTTEWEIIEDYNEDEPAHPFRPYGITPGHGLEWARLMLHARGSRADAGLDVPDWMLEAGQQLMAAAVQDGWDVDGNPGFVYTTDFEGNPVVTQRMHWVLTEAVGVASVLAKALAAEGQAADAALLRHQAWQWWNYAQEHLIESPGRWVHELDPQNQFANATWDGKPDVYHAAQMTLLPRLPVSPTFAAALRDGKLEAVEVSTD